MPGKKMWRVEGRPKCSSFYEVLQELKRWENHMARYARDFPGEHEGNRADKKRELIHQFIEDVRKCID